MPGFYVNDGGGLSSALGNALAGLATINDPKTIAEAQLLREQTEQADRNNWLLSTRQRGVLDTPAALTQAGALPPAPTIGDGSTGAILAGQAAPPGTSPSTPAPATGGSTGAILAGQAVPPAADPLAPGVRDPTRAFNPYAAVVAGSYANDPSMTNFGAGVNLGRNIAQGPGSDFPTQSGIVSAQSTPQHIGTGDTLLINPRLGANAPGNVVVGGDAATIAATDKQRGIDIDDANQKSTLGAAAGSNLAELARLNQIYDTLVNTPDTSDLPGVLSDEALNFIKEKTGFDVTKGSGRIGAMQAIQTRMNSMLGSTVNSVQAGTPIRGILQAVQSGLPDPMKMNPEQYRGAVGQLTRVLQSQVDEAVPANKFKNSHFTKADADAYHNEIGAVQTQHAQDFPKQPEPGAGPAASSAAPAAPPKGPLKQLAPNDILRAQALMRRDGRQHVIQQLQSNGYDTSGL